MGSVSCLPYARQQGGRYREYAVARYEERERARGLVTLSDYCVKVYSRIAPTELPAVRLVLSVICFLLA